MLTRRLARAVLSEHTRRCIHGSVVSLQVRATGSPAALALSLTLSFASPCYCAAQDLITPAEVVVAPKTAPLPEDIVPPPLEDVEAKVKAPPPPLPRLIPLPDKQPLPLTEAVSAAVGLRRAKFTESVELTVRLGIDPKRSDQLVRGVAALPHGTGKRVRVAVFASGTAADQARAAGADVVGAEDLIAKIKADGASGINFDKAVATPAVMPQLSAIARILGPRGLMPNPKTGTLTNDVAAAVQALRQGQVQFRADRYGDVKTVVGKVDFTPQALEANVTAVLQALAAAKPQGAKLGGGGGGKPAGYFRAVHLATTMGRGSVPVSIASVQQVTSQRRS